MNNEIQVTTYFYKSRAKARRILGSLDKKTREEMASVYQKAFGDSPWFEKYRCPTCKSYQRNNSCSICGKINLPDAYPTKNLIQKDFPSMLASFNPGIFILVKDASQKVLGFSQGGFTTPQNLVKKKYDNNKTILDSIIRRCEISSTANIFYDNETCILPKYQKFGIGGRLSEARITAAVEMGAEYICGRTINLPWLALKQQQLSAAGFTFTSFTPNGDRYKVDDVNRQFYFAKKGARRGN